MHSPRAHQLHVFCSHFNPRRFASRVKNYEAFACYMECAGVVLHTVELAFGDRPFEVTDPANPRHLQLRTTSELFHKERILNLAIQRACQMHPEIRYLAWIDADVTFADPRWAQEAVEMLQHFHVLQMFSTAHNLGPNHEVLASYTGIIRAWRDSGTLSWNDGKTPRDPYDLQHHPGFAWAATRWALDQVGGLFDLCIAGSGDTHMAAALCGDWTWAFPAALRDTPYGQALFNWFRRAERSIEHNVGCMDGAVFHAWHGRASQRGYNTRYGLLVEHGFNPTNDLQDDVQGGLAWSGFNSRLQDALRRSLAARNEDVTEV